MTSEQVITRDRDRCFNNEVTEVTESMSFQLWSSHRQYITEASRPLSKSFCIEPNTELHDACVTNDHTTAIESTIT